MNKFVGQCPEVGVRLALPVIVLSIFLLAACSKPEFGSELLNPADGVNLLADSTRAVKTSLEREDSVKTDELSMNLLGEINDPLLGNVSAGFFAQLRMSGSNLSFGNAAQADSLVLVLPYNGGYYGDISSSLGMQQISVYRLTESIYIDSSYYSNDTLAYQAIPIGNSGPVKPSPTDSVWLYGKKQRPQLRIRLSDELAQEFLNNTANFTDNSTFLQFFKGIYVKSNLIDNQPGNGAVFDFRLTSGAGVELHYRNETSDSLLVAFNINENSARFTTFKRKYSQEVLDLITNPMLAQEKTYAANMAGLRTRIDFPNLMSWKGKRKLLINKARLIVPLDPESIDKYPANPLLSLLTKDSTGALQNTLDNLSGVDYAGGTLDNEKKTYTFNIARHLQAILDGTIKDNGLFIQPVGTAVSSYRVKLNGGGNLQNPVRLELLYQELPNP